MLYRKGHFGFHIKENFMKYLYEFIGTFFLVLTIGMTVLEPHAIGSFAPLAIGSVLAVMVFAGAHVSGAHYNPAVSLAVYLRGKLNPKDLGLYWVAQLAAAVAAGSLALYFKEFPTVEMMALDPLKVFLAEFLFTFALCYVVLNVATAKETKANSYFGFAIGFTVLAAIYSIGAVSGGALNPAVALGIAVMNIIHWDSLWIFAAANLLGGAFASFIFKSAHSD